MAEPTEVLNAPTDAYAALSPGARLVAQAYGVVAPHGIGVNRTARILALASVELLGRNLTQADVRRANDELINTGIGTRPQSPNIGVAATRNWAVKLAVKAQQEGRLTKILDAFQATRPNPGVDRYLFETLFRCYAVCGDFGNLDELLEGEESAEYEWRFLAEPLAVDVLATLPDRYIDDALAGCLRHTLDIGAPPEPVIHACHRFSMDPARHAADMAYIRILQGRFDAAQAVFSELPAEVQEAKPAQTGLASTRALIAMLRGDNSAARQHIDAAIAAEKAGTRKRNVFPEHASFALSLIALVRLDTPESRDLMQHLLRTAQRRHLGRDVEVAFAIDAAHVQRNLGIYMHGTTVPCYLTLLDGFRNCWLGSANRANAEWLELMEAYRSRASANGYRWIAAEGVWILHRLVELRGGDPTGLPDPQPLLDELGIQTLAVLEAPMLAWERSLKALEQLAYDAKTQGQANRGTSAPVERRLVWDVHRYYDNVDVTPREQRRNKNGTWSKGRRVALKRLAEEAGSMDHLREEDLAAAAAVTVHRSWGNVDYELGIRGLYALAGHPHVFNDSGEPIEVVRREPELHIDEGPEGLVVVAIDPHGWDAEGEYGITLASDNRFEVTRFTTEHRRLFDVIPPEGLAFPADGKSRLLEAVSALVSQVRVQSDAGPVAGAKEVQADPEPWIRLEPFEAGLRRRTPRGTHRRFGHLFRTGPRWRDGVRKPRR